MCLKEYIFQCLVAKICQRNGGRGMEIEGSHKSEHVCSIKTGWRERKKKGMNLTQIYFYFHAKMERNDEMHKGSIYNPFCMMI